MLGLSLPPLLAGFAAVILAGLLYSGPTFAHQAVLPRLDRLDPVAGLKRLFSGERLGALLRDALKMAVLVAIGATCLDSAIKPGLASVHAGPAAPAAVLRDVLLRCAAIVGAAAAAFALIDAVWSRISWHRRLYMTPREFLRELRETEGDPSLKGRRRRLHREIAEHRMIEDVRKASFVVVNPTHIAVALRWDEETMEAPEVVAAGKHALAQRIIAEARRAGVPVVHDAGLARTLADLRPGETIPEEMYEAVAAVIRVLRED
jgi:flagellar biosynthesis protein FlhB